VREPIYQAFMSGPEDAIELPHGYTYSGHPVAAAAALAALDVYEAEDLFARAAGLAPYFEQAVHALKPRRHVIDIRNIGLVAGIELEPRPGQPTRRAYETFVKCYERGVLIRTTGDTIALSPPLIIERGEIDTLFGTLGEVLDTVH
jgi:beta-alanine--pyruvate transaminase